MSDTDLKKELSEFRKLLRSKLLSWDELEECIQRNRTLSYEERVWCVAQANHFGEGLYNYDQLEKMNDPDLAHAVICAWREYADNHY